MAETINDHGQSSWAEEMFTIRLAVSLLMVKVDKAATGHAWKRGAQRQITVPDIDHGLKHRHARIVAGEPAGSRINEQGKPHPYPTRKIATWGVDGRPICLVVALLPDAHVRVVTVYAGEHGEEPNREHVCH